MHPNESRTTQEAGGWFHRLSGLASSIGVVLVVVAGVLVSPTDRPFLEPSSATAGNEAATGRIGLVDSGLLDSGRAGSGSTQADFQRTPFKLEVMPVRRFDPLADDAAVNFEADSGADEWSDTDLSISTLHLSMAFEVHQADAAMRV